MSEPQEEGTDQSTEPTSAPNVDLSALQAALTTEFDKRFSGMQSLLDRRTQEFQSQLAELKTADLSPEEREQLQVSEAQSRVAALERENELLKLRREYPEEVDLLTDFMAKSSLQEQLTLLSQFRKAQAEAESQGEEPTEQPTPVDKNNPSRKTELSLADFADGNMTGDLAKKILGSSNEKGLLRKLRGG